MATPDQDDRAPQPLPRLIGAGARGVRAVAGATGLDQAAERTTEEAIVRALESPAVARAVARALETEAASEAVEGILTSRAVARALSSPAVEEAIIAALDSQTTDRVWRHILASAEVQMLVERIAEAPEVRAAIASQGVGLVDDLGRSVREVADRFDAVLIRVAERLRGEQAPVEGRPRVGLVTRAVAAALDAAVLNLGFLAITAILGITLGGVIGDNEAPSGLALVAGSFAWVAASSIYLLVFWSLAGQTPGMRLLSIRIAEDGHEHGIGLRRAFRRLVGTFLSILSFGVGFLVVLFDPDRRSWADRMAGTVVVEDDQALVAPHSAPGDERRLGEPRSSAGRSPQEEVAGSLGASPGE